MAKSRLERGGGLGGRRRIPGEFAGRGGVDVRVLAGTFELLSVQDLPPLPGREIFLDWDLDNAKPDDPLPWNVVRHNGVEIFREIATPDGYTRYRQVKTILKTRYGRRFKGLRPATTSLIHLPGRVRRC